MVNHLKAAQSLTMAGVDIYMNLFILAQELNIAI